MPGVLSVVVGPMAAGKSAFLLGIVDDSREQGLRAIAVKPAADTRQPGIRSRNGQKMPATSLTPGSMLSTRKLSGVDVVIFDELHMFDESVILSIKAALAKGKYVVCAGLDTDYRARPFPLVATIASMANNFIRLFAKCSECGDLAEYTQRLVESDDLILVGDSEYAPRCRDCYDPPNNTVFVHPI